MLDVLGADLAGETTAHTAAACDGASWSKQDLHCDSSVQEAEAASLSVQDVFYDSHPPDELLAIILAGKCQSCSVRLARYPLAPRQRLQRWALQKSEGVETSPRPADESHAQQREGEAMVAGSGLRPVLWWRCSPLALSASSARRRIHMYCCPFGDRSTCVYRERPLGQPQPCQ